MDRLIEFTRQWAKDKGILDSKDPKAQMMKVISEVGELADDIGKGNDPRGELGDVIVTLICLSGVLDITLEECLSIAYEKISKRKGQTINGIFVKEGDEHSTGTIVTMGNDSFLYAGDV